jgi:ornithine cyclodeaminase
LLLLDEAGTRAALPMPALVEALRDMFARGCVMPVRHHHEVEVPGEEAATLLLMPAWLPGEFLGVKIVNVFPGNSARGLAAVNASYMLMNGRTGQNLALLDGGELTARRTAAASALAASYLAREEASHLLIVGTGRLAPNLAEAHAAVRPISRISVWGRAKEKSEAVAKGISGKGIKAEAVADLEAAVRVADIVSCATLSAEPLVRGAWLKPGAHLDLIGAFTPKMRESDDEAVTRASVFVDTRAGALKEGGDLVIPIAAGKFDPAKVRAGLAELARGEHPGRKSENEITLFKSVGAALEDLAAAILAYQSADRS